MAEPISENAIRLRIAGALTTTGVVCGVGVVLAIGWNNRGPTDMEDWIPALVAAPGAFLGGLATASLFGKPGRRGAALAVLGAFLATIIGAAIGGTFIYPGIGTIYAPLFLFIIMVMFFPNGLVWIGLMFFVHRYGQVLRGNRETVLFQNQAALPR